MNINELYKEITWRFNIDPEYVYCDGRTITIYITNKEGFITRGTAFYRIEQMSKDTFDVKISNMHENDLKEPRAIQYTSDEFFDRDRDLDAVLQTIDNSLHNYQAAVKWYESIIAKQKEVAETMHELGFKGNGYTSNNVSYILELNTDNMFPYIRFDIPDLKCTGYIAQVVKFGYKVEAKFIDKDYQKCLGELIK